MRTVDEHTITDAVLEAMRDCPDRRLLEVMTALVRHLHDFARDSTLIEALCASSAVAGAEVAL